MPLRPVLAATALLALAAPPVYAAYPGENGAIAFVGERSGQPTIYVRSGGRTRGFLRDGLAADPVFSPQGRRIALTRELPEIGRGVWIFNADGTGARQLTAPELVGAHPTWAPGGRKLAYAAGPQGARTIRIIGADGNRDSQLTFGPADQHDPAWSRRDVIAFTQTNPSGEDVYTVPARGGTPRQLTTKPGDDADPAWSPDGRRLAFVRGRGGIWVMSRFGRGARRVVHVPGGPEQGVAWSPDGKRLAFAGGPPGERQIFTVRADGKQLRALSLPSSNGSDPDWRAVGQAPLIAAAGDIACDPTGRSFKGGLGTPNLCAMGRTSDLLLGPDLAAVLVLGDVQYPSGELDYFFRSFGPSWGRIKPLLRPVPGNHEYRTPGASGYYDWFNGEGAQRGPAGDRSRGGYYSFDVGKWHIIALDSNCRQVPGGCGEGSPQQRWLAADLARNSKYCTMAFWHHPLYSSRASEEGRGSTETRALWKTLHDAGADLVVSAHQHFYERLAPQDSNGNLDKEFGLRSFVVGTGGKSLDQADFSDANSQAFSADSYGVLELRLQPRGYEWKFQSAGPEAYFDSGRSAC